MSVQDVSPVAWGVLAGACVSVAGVVAETYAAIRDHQRHGERMTRFWRESVETKQAVEHVSDPTRMGDETLLHPNRNREGNMSTQNEPDESSDEYRNAVGGKLCGACQSDNALPNQDVCGDCYTRGAR